MTSGITTVSKEFVFGTQIDLIGFNSITFKHPEQGKEMDLGEDLRKQTGIEDAIIKDCLGLGMVMSIFLDNL